VQVRGGCVCAGTYGHYLLNVSHEKSKQITDKINQCDLSEKPGWVRLSIHPTLKNEELYYIIDAIKQIQRNHLEWAKDYSYDRRTNEFMYNKSINDSINVESWFNLLCD
jgi:hypothetical protein